MRRVLVVLLLLAAAPAIAAVDTVTVGGKVYISTGAVATAGSVACTLAAATTAPDGAATVPVGPSTSVGTIGVDGTLNGLALVPTSIMTPASARYSCRFNVTSPRSVQWARTSCSVDATPDPLSIGSMQCDMAATAAPVVPGAANTIVVSNGSGALAAAAGATWTATQGLVDNGTYVTRQLDARRHAAQYGAVGHFLDAAVFETWFGWAKGHPLIADWDRDGTNGGASSDQKPGVGSWNVISTVTAHYAGNASNATSHICAVADPDSDGTDEIAVGDTIFFGDDTHHTGSGKTYVVEQVQNGTNPATNCPTGTNNWITVSPYLVPSEENIVLSTTTIAQLWRNLGHPSRAGSELLGHKLATAPRVRDGLHGPNLLRNGAFDCTGTAAENWTVSTGSLTCRSFNASGTGVGEDQCFEGATNACVSYNTSTQGAYIQSVEPISVTPGDVLALTCLYSGRSNDEIALVDDSDGDGTYATTAGLTHNLGSSNYWTGNFFGYAGPLRVSWTIPERVHSVKVRFTRGDTTGNRPLIDACRLRKVTTFAADSTSDASPAAYLIEDPGTGNISFVGDSLFDPVGSGVPPVAWGTYTAEGLAAGLQTRLGRDVSAQIKVRGVNGAKVADLLGTIDASLATDAPLYTIVSIGINDLSQGTALATYMSGLRMLVAKIKAAGSVPIIVEMPPWGQTGAGQTFEAARMWKDTQRNALLNTIP